MRHGWRWLSALAVGGCLLGSAAAQEPAPPPAPLPAVPALDVATKRLPINLPCALQLAQVRPIDVQVASERIRVAQAQLQRARAAWLPNVVWGMDYARHDGRIQDIVGNVFPTSRQSIMFGAGPNLVFSVSDAVFAPLAARQTVRAREAGLQAAVNDTALAVAEAYFNVQQARGELAGAAEAARLADDLVQRAEKLAAGLAPPVEVNRVRAEAARRRIAVEQAQERWQTAGAELHRLLRLDPAAMTEPVEPPHLRVDLVNAAAPIDDLITVGLTFRPELASQQAVVQATLARLRQERLRPLVPSVLLRGNATNPGGTLSGGTFGGGVDGGPWNSGGRHSFDVQVLWEIQGLGLGNRAGMKERKAENQLAMLELFRTQDRVAAEVAQAQAQATRAAKRATLAEAGLADAFETVTRSLEGLNQTRRLGDTLVLVFRPLEVVAAVQALDLAYRDYYTAVADANRAQFRLYRALGHPAQCILTEVDKMPPPAAAAPPRTDAPSFTPPPGYTPNR